MHAESDKDAKRDPPKLLVVNLQCILCLLHLPVCGTGVVGQPLQKGINFGSSEVPSVTVPLELVEQLTHPVRVEGVSLFLDAEVLKHLEVALGPLGIGVKWCHRRPA